MKKSGLADSPFFANPRKASEPASFPIRQDAVDETLGKGDLSPRKQPSNQANMQSSKHASVHAEMQDSIIELIRKAVKDVGKESATYRFTPEEKKALLELTFTYKVQGYKTSENELTRIAINFVLEDHKQNGRNSILEKVLQALNE
jgi:citrate lyase gamma subunit